MTEKQLDISTVETELNIERLREQMIAMLQSDDLRADMFTHIFNDPAKCRAILEDGEPRGGN